MANAFVQLRLKTDEKVGDWQHAVNVAHIVSILPRHMQATKELEQIQPGERALFHAIPDDEAEVAAKGLLTYYEVTDTIGRKFWSPLGDNAANDLLGKLYAEAVK